MVDIKEVEQEENTLRSQLAISKNKVSNVLRARILAHIDILKNGLNERIETISDMADNPVVWKAKSGVILQKIQKERKQLVDMLSGWESQGF